MDGTVSTMQVAVYAALRLETGTKHVEVTAPPAATVRDLLVDLTVRYPGLSKYVWAADGGYRNFLKIFVNGADIRSRQGIETLVMPADRIDIFTPVSGG